jgi:hypothetical protein
VLQYAAVPRVAKLRAVTNSSGLKKYDYYKGPQPLGTEWTLKRGDVALVCTLSTHSLGWELRLKAGANFLRSQVCKIESDVAATSAAWQAEAKAKGWV